ncbi:MAG: aldo/keto reductase [Firmicutes bacterium]|nr:aldo/keto reductase [Candidatus Colimorpha enterica]
MYYNAYKEKKLSALGLGMMRLPKDENGSVDEVLTAEMIKKAIENGVNYFDTAYVYHHGESENIAGRLLSKYPRESYNLASKYPGFLSNLPDDPAEIFEEQLKKCNTEYFDFYLLHSMTDDRVDFYADGPILPYLLEQKKNGRIKHLGFSSHCSPDGLARFLEKAGQYMEFCQIELNYLDWTYQDAKKQYEIIRSYSLDVWVMEPVRGGKLAKLPENLAAKLKAVNPDASSASWGFRWLQRLDGIAMILSGMSNMEQLDDNLKTFSERVPLDDEGAELLLNIAEELKHSVPCTGCRYCCDGCPMALNIPELIKIYNVFLLGDKYDAKEMLSALSDEEKPNNCLSCGACSSVCPQGIDIPDVMAKLSELL